MAEAMFTRELSNRRRVAHHCIALVSALDGTAHGERPDNTYSVWVRTQREVVDYALQRRALLAGVHSGRIGNMEVCDASPYLLRAAKFHGVPSASACPLCRKEALTNVSWVYGDELKHVAGSARAPEELTRMANLFGEFTVYVVEVCRSCSWNHLVQSYVLGTGTPHPGSRRTAGQ